MYTEFLRFNQELFFIDAVEISRNGKYIALSKNLKQKNIKILFIETAKSKIIENVHQKKIKILKFFPCSSKLLSGSIDNNIKVIDIFSSSILHSIKLIDWCNTLDIFSNGNVLTFGTIFKYAGIWEIERGYVNYKLIQHDCIISSIATFNDQERVVSSSLNKIKIWNYNTVRLIHNLNGHKGVVSIVRVVPDDSKIISTGTDFKVKIWNTSTGEQINSFNISTKIIKDICITNNGKNFITTFNYMNEYTRLVDINTGYDIFLFTDEIDKNYFKKYKMTISNGNIIATITDYDEMIIWKLDRFVPTKRVENLLIKGLNEDIAGIIMKYAVAKKQELAQFKNV